MITRKPVLLLASFTMALLLGCGNPASNAILEYIDGFQSKNFEKAFQYSILQGEARNLEQFEKTKLKVRFEQENKDNGLSTPFVLFKSNCRVDVVELGEPDERAEGVYNYAIVDIEYPNEVSAPGVQLSGRAIVDKFVSRAGESLLKDQGGIKRGMKRIRLEMNIVKYTDPATGWLVDDRFMNAGDQTGLRVIGIEFFDGSTFGNTEFE